MSEADTRRDLIMPKLQAAGWDTDPCSIAEERTITDGRIVPRGRGFARLPPKRVDFLLEYRRDFALAVVEAKASHRAVADGMQQAKQYAEMLDLKFAYATNGHELLEFDYFSGRESRLESYPSPEELWRRYELGAGIESPLVTERLLAPFNREVGKGERYYQKIAIHRTVEAILAGRKRILLTMATGTGKTAVAFQICWKLWNSRWNRDGAHRGPRILYLADRNILVDQPKDGIFAAFGDARAKLESGVAVKSREMYFGIYQALVEENENRDTPLYKQYQSDFFDLVIVDECHRGSARDDSSWRAILDHFSAAYQVGMTATPLREDNRDTYLYFGNPIYEYSLRQGIEDGFLAPYRVHRIVSEWDAAGWRPSAADRDRYGRAIPDDEYQTGDFERVIALRKRTEAIAKHLSRFMRDSGDRFAKTIVFCVDQEHASEMRIALGNCNDDLVASAPDYVCRVTADEAEIGKGHLSRFQDLDTRTPSILTTSQLLTTGVDAPTCKNVVLARVVNSMTEFKQIIGRGTRVRDDYDKLWFNIIDYTGSATRLFADPAFDGTPSLVTEEELEDYRNRPPIVLELAEQPGESAGDGLEVPAAAPDARRKFYFDGGAVAIAAHLVYELAPDGTQLRVVRYTDYAAESVRSLYPSVPALHDAWSDPIRRGGVIDTLGARGIDFDELAKAAGQPDSDPFDLLCHLAFSAPLRTRRERARSLKSRRPDFFAKFSPEARAVLNELLEKYSEHGVAQFVLPDVLQVPPLSSHGTVGDIVRVFGGAEALRSAVAFLQSELYAA